VSAYESIEKINSFNYSKHVEHIKTAKGIVDIEIVEKNVFLPNGYTFIGFHQKIIPKIREIVKGTCNQVNASLM
jgi:hypothetical protein